MSNGTSLGEAEIRRIIDNLYASVGVRLNIDCNLSDELPNAGNFMQLCNIVTRHMDLPIKVIPDFASDFISSGMVKSEANSTSGICAQVSIPQDLPWYGSTSMVNFPIKINVRLGKHDAYYLLTQLSHEFSHIYLYSCRDPQRDSEYATDICALMMGFEPVWERGRKQRSSTAIVTQGYLTDEDYKTAISYIRKLRANAKGQRDEAKHRLSTVKSLCAAIDAKCARLPKLLRFHYVHPEHCSLGQADATTFSKLSQPHYLSDITDSVKAQKSRTNEVVRHLKNLRTFRPADVDAIAADNIALAQVIDALTATDTELSQAIDAIRRNIDTQHYDREFSPVRQAIESAKTLLTDAVTKLRDKLSALALAVDELKSHRRKKAVDEPTLQSILDGSGTADIHSAIHQAITVIDSLDHFLTQRTWYDYTPTEVDTLKADHDKAESSIRCAIDSADALIKVAKANLTAIGRLRLRHPKIARIIDEG